VGLAAASPELVEGLRQGPSAFSGRKASACTLGSVTAGEGAGKVRAAERDAGRRSAPGPT